MRRRGKKTTTAGRRLHEVAAPQSAVELRIIAGSWRGRRWRFPAIAGVRPTPNRVRETLFNWLAPRILGARCLDLCAGSGALGLEALSRGAAQVIFVDQQREAVRSLESLLKDWQGTNYQIHCSDAADWLSRVSGLRFDIVFLDPPFSADLVPKLLARLRTSGCLAPAAWIYLEQPATLAPPADWHVHRSGRAGAVGYYLLHEA